eukprot:XP_016656684.1 PREDICTED: uncharacterized protein LOC100572330 [Acyrthosiphon pisum]
MKLPSTSTRDTSARQKPSGDCFRTICTAKVTWSSGFLFTWRVVRTCTLRRAKKKNGYRTKLYVTRNSRSSSRSTRPTRMHDNTCTTTYRSITRGRFRGQKEISEMSDNGVRG